MSADTHVAADNESNGLISIGDGAKFHLGTEAMFLVARDKVIGATGLQARQFDNMYEAPVGQSIDRMGSSEIPPPVVARLPCSALL